MVETRIVDACKKAGRSRSEVTLVAVSKRHPFAAVLEAYDAGLRDFGENYAQELTEKSALSDLPDVRWHMIGHLQRNKCRDVVPIAHMIHTADTLRLGEAIARHATACGRDASVLVQVNVGGEAQKEGCHPHELAALLEQLRSLSSLVVRGLMTVPPVATDEHPASRYFEALASLRDRHGGATALPELSMGMTVDLEAAIAAGATIVRVGTAIFGER
ncbi:MAG: YggS family pyridoxal phosphate-dependent enzyme [Deltaproteobacteria bacterium]|nr:YggS family pyridoxal phosphate-dependent enzyme [Deltaproteobacteria bacterium]